MSDPTEAAKELLEQAAQDYAKHNSPETQADAKINLETVKILKNDIPIPQDGEPKEIDDRNRSVL